MLECQHRRRDSRSEQATHRRTPVPDWTANPTRRPGTGTARDSARGEDSLGRRRPQRLRLRVQPECDCDQPEPFGPNRVFVVDVVTHFGYRESLDGFTVLGLFDRIEVAILDAHPIDVTYDSDNGFPTLIRLGIDNETDEADFDLETRSLMSFVELRSAHADAAKRWSDSSISDYDLAYEVRCSCEDTGATVAVRNGDVVEKTFAKPDSPIGLEPVTVDSLFAEVEAAIDDKAYTIAVRYHPDLGYPISVEVDRDDRSGDERLTTITSLEPLDL